MITQLEPDILECEIKWALGSISMNKASGGDGIPVELFQILKDDAVKVLHSICQLESKSIRLRKNTDTLEGIGWKSVFSQLFHKLIRYI